MAAAALVMLRKPDPTTAQSRAVFNTMSYQNPDLDKLIDAARFADDPSVYDQLVR
jgi:ABC-type oligopeptide transport system substrate-binding subunit